MNQDPMQNVQILNLGLLHLVPLKVHDLYKATTIVIRRSCCIPRIPAVFKGTVLDNAIVSFWHMVRPILLAWSLAANFSKLCLIYNSFQSFSVLPHTSTQRHSMSPFSDWMTSG